MANPNAQTQRVHVLFENTNEIAPEVKRNQYTPDTQLKVRVLSALFHVHEAMFRVFKLTTEEKSHLNYTSQITSHILSVHHKLRQESNPQGGGHLGTKIKSPLTISKPNSPQITLNDFQLNIIGVFRAYKLEYELIQGKPPAWYGLISPYITYAACFPSRLNEVRIGCSSFPVGKTNDNKVQYVNISQLGLNNSHHIHLEGITYPPHRRSSIAQSTGPLTQLIMLHKSKSNSHYAERWVRSCTKTLAHLPKSDELISRIKNCNLAEASELLPIIGDILSITGSRANCKAFFPYAVLRCFLTDEATIYYSGDPTAPLEDDGPPVYVGRMYTPFEHFDVSGKGAFYLYKHAVATNFQMQMAAPAEVVSQVVFHAIWGSHWEDLKVIEFMTGKHFYTRRELAKSFQKKGDAPSITFTIPPIAFYAKLSQALTTDYTCGGQQQTWIRPTFSGKRKSSIGEVFSAHLKKMKTGSQVTLAPTSLLNYYSNYRRVVAGRALQDITT